MASKPGSKSGNGVGPQHGGGGRNRNTGGCKSGGPGHGEGGRQGGGGGRQDGGK